MTQQPQQHPLKLVVQGVSKAFPGVQALRNVNFTLRRGEVHVLCGENGAGKSTLMKIINGVYRPDAGTMLLNGQPVVIRDPSHARSLGIAMIFQELNYVPQMTVAEFFFLGRLPLAALRRVDWRKVRQDTETLLRAEGLNYSPASKMWELSISDIQMLEIVKAVSQQADLIIMDEPTSAITLRETEHLFTKIRQLRAAGVSIIYISHKMDEFSRIADSITVLRDGEVIDSQPSWRLTVGQVIRMMVGREIKDSFPKIPVPRGEKILEVQHLYRRGYFNNISFTVHSGEIVGFAGMVGAGRTEVMRSIFGLDPHQQGEIFLRGRPVRIDSVSQGMSYRMAMLTEDRRRYGLIPVRSVRENISLASLGNFFSQGHWLQRKEVQTVNELCRQLAIKASSALVPVSQLSGGNQQKVVLAKWLLTTPDLFIMDEPTRGIDVGAKYEIYHIMVKLAQQGKAIILVSSELPELLGMCDRIYVMSEGKIRGHLERAEFSEEKIMHLAMLGEDVA